MAGREDKLKWILGIFIAKKDIGFTGIGAILIAPLIATQGYTA